MGTLITGDIHNVWGELNTLINKKRDRIDRVICCGDFGYWPGKGQDISKLKNGDIPIYWCDGNHEDHWALAQRESDEVAPNVFYMPRGSTLDLPDGRRILFMGGAHSVDKNSRTVGFDWFPEETPTQRDFMNCPPDDTRIDILISHTCSYEIAKKVMIHLDNRKHTDPAYHILAAIEGIYKPSLWYFGHWHDYSTGVTDRGCRWTCLAMPGRYGWWEWLPERR